MRLIFNHLSEDVDGQWLLVLDNADDSRLFFERLRVPTQGSERNEPLCKYIPRNQQGTILVTTRDKHIGHRLAGSRAVVVLEPMGKSEATELLCSRMDEDEGSDAEAVNQLLEALDYLPLAITQAAAFISQNDITLPQYLQLLCNHDSQTQALLEKDLGDPRRDLDSDHSVIRTWKISMDVISERNALAAETLYFMAMIDRQAIPRSLLPQDTDVPLDIIEALGVLQAFSLIKSVAKGESYQMHRLVQLSTQRWLETQGQTKQWQKQVILRIESMIPLDLFGRWEYCDKLYPHAQKVLQYEDIVDETRALLLRKVSRIDMSRARYEAAQSKCERAFDIQHRLFGIEHTETMRIMYSLARNHCNLEQWKKALDILVPLIEAHGNIHGMQNEMTLRNMACLGRVYGKMGDLKEAEELLLLVLDTSKRSLGDEHWLTFQSTEYLSRVYIAQEQPKAAEKLIVKLLGTMERSPVRDDVAMLEANELLAECYFDQGRYEKAEVLSISIVNGYATLYGLGNPFTISSKITLAKTYWCQRRHLKAIDLMKEVLYAAKQNLGPNHPQTISSTKFLEEWIRESAEEQDPSVNQGSQHEANGRRENEELEHEKEEEELSDIKSPTIRESPATPVETHIQGSL